jgi:hypothetical protein
MPIKGGNDTEEAAIASGKVLLMAIRLLPKSQKYSIRKLRGSAGEKALTTKRFFVSFVPFRG